MKKALVVGGAKGIGLAIAVELSKRADIDKVLIVDKAPVQNEYISAKVESFQFDVSNPDYNFFCQFNDIDTLMITAGFGRLALFRDIDDEQIATYFNVNTISAIRLIKFFYDKLEGKPDFYCGIVSSIAGFMSSPFFSCYAATKAALKIFIESVNVELFKSGSKNRILNVAPGKIEGTSFGGGDTDLSKTKDLAKKIIDCLEKKNDLLIPDYDTVFKDVLERYHNDFRKEGIHSYEYKLKSGRVKQRLGK